MYFRYYRCLKCFEKLINQNVCPFCNKKCYGDQDVEFDFDVKFLIEKIEDLTTVTVFANKKTLPIIFDENKEDTVLSKLEELSLKRCKIIYLKNDMYSIFKAINFVIT